MKLHNVCTDVDTVDIFYLHLDTDPKDMLLSILYCPYSKHGGSIDSRKVWAHSIHHVGHIEYDIGRN